MERFHLATSTRRRRFECQCLRLDSLWNERIVKNGATHIIAQLPISVHAQYGKCAIWRDIYGDSDVGVGNGLLHRRSAGGRHAECQWTLRLVGICDRGHARWYVDHDHPTALTSGGHEAKVPYSITLDAGDAYEVYTADFPSSRPAQIFNDCIDDFPGQKSHRTIRSASSRFNAHNSEPCATRSVATTLWRCCRQFATTDSNIYYSVGQSLH